MGVIYSGACLFLTSRGNPKKHLHVVLNDPSGAPPTVAVVSLSTALKADSTVVLNAGDHSFIREETFVVYAWAKVLLESELEEIILADMSLKHRHDCSPVLLERLRKGVFSSPFSTPKFQEYCRERFPTEVIPPLPQR
jgi:hypothetical protein